MSNEGRIPPQAVEVEEAVLGSMLIEAEAADISISLLRPDDFYRPANKHVFETLLELYDQNVNLDLLSVEEKLRDKELLDVVGGTSYLSELTRSVSSASNIDYHCQIIQEKATKRNLITHCNQIIKNAFESGSDAEEVLDQAQAAIFSLTEHESGSMREMSEVMQRVFKNVEQIQEEGQPIGLRTGLDIDKTLQGFQDGKLYVIGARPSMGKTALALTILRRFATDDIRCGILSLETTDRAIGTRLVSQVSGLSVDTITSGQMTGEQIRKFSDACSQLSELGIIVDDQAALSIQQVRSKCRLMAKKGARAVFIDFLTLISAEGQNKHLEVGNITKTLKQISKEIGIPVIVLAQLSRSLENRNDKRPQMSDLRESGSIEEDADAILFLYRPEYYGKETDEEGNSTAGVCEVIIAKNKDGKTGLQRQRFVAETMTFENLEWKHQEFKEPLQAPQPHYLDDIDDEPEF